MRRRVVRSRIKAVVVVVVADVSLVLGDDFTDKTGFSVASSDGFDDVMIGKFIAGPQGRQHRPADSVQRQRPCDIVRE